MLSYVLLAAYCLAIAGVSFLGGSLPQWLRLTHVRMQLLLSFVAGLMLGVAMFHLLPHSAAVLPSVEWTTGGCMLGLLGTLFLLRLFHFHQHGPEAQPLPGPEEGHGHGEPAPAPPHVHSEACAHHHDHHHDHAHGPGHEPHGHGASSAPRSIFGWVGVALGLGLHTLSDGVALGAAVQAEAHAGHALPLYGVATFLAVLLHKPLDALAITSLMRSDGWSRGWTTAVNAAFALVCPVGALLVVLSVQQFGALQDWILGGALAFSAGVFLCLALGDLLPEVHFHSHDRLKLTGALLLGVLTAFAVEHLPGHEHSHSHGPGAAEHEHVHEDGHEHEHGGEPGAAQD